MVIHRRSHAGIPTRTNSVRGYLWKRLPCRSIAHMFTAKSPLDGNILQPPYVDIESAFTGSSQREVFDTLIRIPGHTLLVSAYFDARLGPNPNLKRDFPDISWRGEIAVLFVGRRKPYIKRAPPDSVVRYAIARYMGLCIAHVELGSPFPAYMKAVTLNSASEHPAEKILIY